MAAVAVVLLVGLPGSGKSSLCANLIKYLGSEFTVAWVQYDDLLLETGVSRDDETSYTWKKWRHAIALCVERLIKRWLRLPHEADVLPEECRTLFLRMPNVERSVKSKLLLLLDDNFYYSSMRRTYYLLAKKYCLAFGCLACRVPVSVCLERNSRRSSPIPEEIITRMNNKVEWPGASSSTMWEKHVLFVDFSLEFTSLLDSVGKFLILVISQPLDCTEELIRLEHSKVDRQNNLDSVFHGIDASLRLGVRELLQSVDSVWRSDHANLVSQVRLTTMKFMRTEVVNDEKPRSLDEYRQMALQVFRRNLDNAVSK